MDYGNGTYYGGGGGNGHYHPSYIGITPMTPSGTSATEDFVQNNHNHSPNGIYDAYSSQEQFPPGFDPLGQYGHHNPNFPGAPPTPPSFPPNGLDHGTHGDLSRGQLGRAETLVSAKSDPDTGRQAGSNSDEDDMNPAQSRRKQQNRNAQRAFRERKEKHVKDLEAKLANLEQAQSKTAEENKRLMSEMQKISTENEILRATSSVQAQHNGSISPVASVTTGPMQYNPREFYDDLLKNHANKTPSHRIVESDGQRLLAAGAAWEYIINHDLFRKGVVDVGVVSERLRGQAKCDGQGPVFEEHAIQQAIVDSVASGSDELL
ncbi:hypothetical protein F4808DRAFT_373197 [Astrocystis sublimbata]|nr:hypothetical protein F4808DRAFT_373197 [Astrocystis sublimbata]